MPELEPLYGTPKLILALKEVLELEEDLFGWAHNQEHYFQHTEYCGLVKFFDKKVADARERRRPILDRVFQLGGTVDGVETAPEGALDELLDRLKAIHKACQDAYDALDDDYVTEKLLAENQKHVEKCIEKVQQKLAKKALIGEQLWLDRLV